MKAYILIKVRVGEIREVVKSLRRIDSVIEANMTFGPYDIVAILNADNVNDIGHLIASNIQPIPGVLETLTCLAVEP
jgi:DNA-binding Lrp family transcriptional regulator